MRVTTCFDNVHVVSGGNYVANVNTCDTVSIIGGCRVGHIRAMPDLNFSDPPFCHKKY